MDLHLRKLKNNETHHRALVSLLMTVFIVTLTIAYGAYQSEYRISGEARIEVQKDIRITSIKLYETLNDGLEEYKPNYNVDTIKTSVMLPNSLSTVTYKIEVTNYSNIPTIIKEAT